MTMVKVSIIHKSSMLTCLLASVMLTLLTVSPATASAEQPHETGLPVSPQASQHGTELPGLIPELIYAASEPFTDIDSANLDGLLARIGDSRLVLIGESSHGTAEFYDMRARITRELIAHKGFTVIAAEADWPDASAIDYFVRGSSDRQRKKPRFRVPPFSGYPSWMWANESVLAFSRWLKDHNRQFHSAADAVGFYGLDLYNLFGSIDAVLDYLQDIDPRAARSAYSLYRCLMPWSNDPAIYGRVMHAGRHRGCEYEVATVLDTLQRNQVLYKALDEQHYFDALQNARLVKNGERYFRTLFDDNTDSWNQRDQNMYDMLLAILEYRGPAAKAIIWAHNSHIGDSRATERSRHGEFNLGQKVRETFGDSAYLIGFGTDHGSVAASSAWGAPMQVMPIPPSREDSYGYLFHQVSADNFLLPLRSSDMHTPAQQTVREQLLTERLQRAIGTAYDPQDELKKHYTGASLPRQFDEYIWFDESHALTPLP